MARLGVVGRADAGGLAAQSLDVAVHLRPEAVLIVDLGERGRGPVDLSGWSSLGVPGRVTDPLSHLGGIPSDDEIRWLVERCDVLYTPECTYHHGVAAHCAEQGTRLLIHANPELWDERYFGPTTLACNPSAWRMDLLPAGSILLPMPTTLAAAPWSAWGPASVAAGRPFTFLHVTQPAMYDRAGSDAVLAALELVTQPCRLIVRGPHRASFPDRVGVVQIEQRGDVRNRWQVYADADCLLAPRRYGGLSLLMLEAAGLGLPIITTDVEPQAGWFEAAQLPCPRSERMPTRGGEIDVWQPDPAAIAYLMDAHVGLPDVALAASEDSYRWARSMAWDARLPEWEQLIHG